MQTYALLDTGDGLRLEQWGPYKIVRPEPSAHWNKTEEAPWSSADAIYTGSSVQNGSWDVHTSVPDSWPISLGQWQFSIGLGSSKHVGLFPEQLEQWELLHEVLSRKAPAFTEPIRCLNLFAYTGAASIVAAMAGAFTTHVDSSAPAIGRAKENQALNKLSPTSIRWIRDDVLTFVQREIRRGHFYDVICLDPPAYGHGTKGERFSVEKDFTLLLMEVQKLLSKTAIAVFVTTYSDNRSPQELNTRCQTVFPQATITAKPLTLITESTQRPLSTGSWAVAQF